MHAKYGKTNRQQPRVSESVVGSDGSAAVDNHLDFGALAPLSSLDAVCFFALRLGKQVEIDVDLLSLVLVVVNTQLVVVS